MKTILLMTLLSLLPISAYANSTTLYGSCSNSYFIEKEMNILDTMNLLISGAPSNDEFTCQSFSLYQTKDQEYKLDVNTQYDNKPYILEFIGKQAPNNNGLVFIPSDVILINYKTEQVVSHFGNDKIIGACDVDIKHIYHQEALSCLIALKKDSTSIAVKIHFTEKQ